MNGLTLKQLAKRRFYQALDEYKEALESKDSTRIVVASVAVYRTRRNREDRRTINRVFRECSGPCN